MSEHWNKETLEKASGLVFDAMMAKEQATKCQQAFKRHRSQGIVLAELKMLKAKLRHVLKQTKSLIKEIK